MSASKCLIAFDPKRPLMRNRDYLAPFWDGEAPKFLGMKSGEACTLGRVVFATRPLEVDEMIDCLAAAGHASKDDPQARNDIRAFIELCNQQKSGAVLEIRTSAVSELGFDLVETGIKPFASAQAKF
jgi:hypothetical protein